MSAPSDAERAREIALSIRDVIGTCVCPEDFHNPDCGPCAVAHAVEPALSAARAEGRAEGRAEEREACARIADDYEKDSCGNDCMGGCADCAWFTARREIAAAIRGRKP